MNSKIKIADGCSDIELPRYMTDGSAGMDCPAAVYEDFTILPGSQAFIPLGFHLAIEAGYEAQIRPRSGLTLRNGITIPNSPATIDSDYRGQISVILRNEGSENFIVSRGMRIAQIVFAKVEQVVFEVVTDFDITARGDNGFGSTGFGSTGVAVDVTILPDNHTSPIYQACIEHGLAVMSHAFGSGGQPITGCGWPSFYIEDHVGPSQSMQANLISLVVEGVFERFPTLRVVSAENGFAWVPSLLWRLDNTYGLLRDETPHLQRKPSEYVRDHVWFCTQPVEEPDRPDDLPWLIEQVGADHLIFASDYAHWDWDAPDTAIPARLPDDMRRNIYYNNALALYGDRLLNERT